MMYKKFTALAVLITFCFLAFAPVMESVALAAPHQNAAHQRQQAERARKMMEAKRKQAEYERKVKIAQKRHEFRKANIRQRQAMERQKARIYFQGHPDRLYHFVYRNRNKPEFKKYYRSKWFKGYRVMRLEQWETLLGALKFKEMLKNRELVEDDTVVVDKAGDIVGINDETLEQGVEIVGADEKAIPVLGREMLKDGIYNPAYQFMHNGKTYKHGIYRGHLKEKLRIMPSVKWIEAFGIEKFTQMLDAGELTEDTTVLLLDDGMIVGMRDDSLGDKDYAYDEYDKMIPKITSPIFDEVDPAKIYGYIHCENGEKYKHGFYKFGKNKVFVLHSYTLLNWFEQEDLDKYLQAKIMTRLDPKDVVVNLDGKLLAIYDDSLVKDVPVVDRYGNPIKVLHEGETIDTGGYENNI